MMRRPPRSTLFPYPPLSRPKRDITAGTLEPPLGSGPYRIKTVIPGRTIVYERVPDYWGQKLNVRSEEHTSELQSRQYLVCRLLLEKKKKQNYHPWLNHQQTT